LLCQQDQWSWRLLMRRVNSTGLISQLIWTHYTKHLAAILFMHLTKLKWTSETSGNLWSTSPSQVVLQHRLNLKDFASEQSQEQLGMTAKKMVLITWLVTHRRIKSTRTPVVLSYEAQTTLLRQSELLEMKSLRLTEVRAVWIFAKLITEMQRHRYGALNPIGVKFDRHHTPEAIGVFGRKIPPLRLHSKQSWPRS